jgi:hypothetical protein
MIDDETPEVGNLYGAIHLYLDAFGPLTAAQLAEHANDDEDLGALREVTPLDVTREAQKLIDDGAVMALLSEGFRVMYRLVHHQLTGERL